MDRKRLRFIQTILFCKYMLIAMDLIQIKVNGE